MSPDNMVSSASVYAGGQAGHRIDVRASAVDGRAAEEGASPTGTAGGLAFLVEWVTGDRTACGLLWFVRETS